MSGSHRPASGVVGWAAAAVFRDVCFIVGALAYVGLRVLKGLLGVAGVLALFGVLFVTATVAGHWVASRLGPAPSSFAMVRVEDVNLPALFAGLDVYVVGGLWVACALLGVWCVVLWVRERGRSGHSL